MLVDAGHGARGGHDDVVTQAPALWSSCGSPPRMDRPHRHDDVELNHVRSGRLRYLFGGTSVTVDAGEVALFWGATPHQLVEPGTEPGHVSWVHVPLSTVLSWGFGTEDVRALLHPEPLVVPATRLGRDLDGLFATWHLEVQQDDAAVALLEAQALVRRLLRHRRRDGHAAAEDGGAPAPGGARRDHRPGQVGTAVAMARFIADRFRDPVTVEDVAAAGHVTPAYATTLFRRTVGCSIGAYLRRVRVAEAQRLLVATERTTAEIGYASGFGSQSQFYEHFTRTCGQPPGRYRVAVRRD